MSLGSGQRCDLGGLPAPLVVLSAWDMRSALLSLQALQKWQLGFGSFCILCIILSQLCMHTAIFSPL